MTIKEYAKSCKHKIVGKLTRYTPLETMYSSYNKDGRYRFYIDEAKNEYWVDTFKSTVAIVTADGGVI